MRSPAFAWKSPEPDMLGRDTRDSDDNAQPRRVERVGGKVVEERRVAAWIGASIVVKGNLTSSEDLTIAGQVEGNVTVREHTLVIAPRGRVRGDIIARTVAVHGEVTGTITADRKVEIGATGSVEGDIKSPRMVVDEGAVLHGRIGITSPASPASPTPG